jgi:hypothetical protein
MQAFELNQLTQTHSQLGKLYYEFLREPSMSLGLIDPPRFLCSR